MSVIQRNDGKASKAAAARGVSLFMDWNKLHPTPELQRWRTVNEPIINDALSVKERLEALVSLLNEDVCTFCDDCDSVKCWGSIFPICEPMLRKFTSIIEK